MENNFEFRLHKNGVTLLTSFISSNIHVCPARLMLDRQYFEVCKTGAFLEIRNETVQVITRWPMDEKYREPYPYFTEVPFLLHGDRYILEFRRVA